MQEYNHEFADHWHHIPSPLEKAGGLWIVRAGRNLAKPDYFVGPRISTHYSLHFVLEGQVRFRQGDENVVLQTGDIFCLYPNRLYSYRIHRRDLPLRMFWLAFNGSQSDYLLQRLGFETERFHVLNMIDEQVLHRIHRIIGIFVKEQTGSHNLSLLCRVYQLFDRLSANATLGITQESAHSWLEDALNYMNLHFREHLCIEEIAELVGVNRSHFTRMFSRKMNVTPKQYIQSLKMHEANQLLVKSPISISEIALSLGYPDLYSFTRAYKNAHGFPPSRARQTGNLRSLLTPLTKAGQERS